MLALAAPSEACDPGHGDCAPFRILFDGWIANRCELTTELNLSGSAANAQIYAAALTRWGDGADAHIDGHYAAIAAAEHRPHLRLARSPFVAPPLHYARAESAVIASSLVRSLALLPSDPLAELDHGLLLALLAGETAHAARGWYRDTARVPLGTALLVDPALGGAREIWRYRLTPRAEVANWEDAAVVAHARALLDRAVAAASRGAAKPAASLSGGLDSGLVTESLLRQSGERRIESFTYAPETGHGLVMDAEEIGDESGAVEAFAAFHSPRLRAHIVRNEGFDFRSGLDDLLGLVRCAPREMGIVAELGGAMASAAAQGCDVMLGGDEGNSTFSASGGWAYRHAFKRGEWRRLWRELRLRTGDRRPLWRRFGGLVLDDWLPGRRPCREVPRSYFAALCLDWAAVQEAGLPESPALAYLRRRHRRSLDRAELARMLAARDDGGRSDALKALELRYGIVYRDPTVTRAMVEFCLALPARQFLRDGEDRHLARRMAQGRMPEAQRTSRGHGVTHSDWHHRLVRARSEVLGEIGRMEADPDIAAMLDLDGMKRKLAALASMPGGSEDERLFVTAGLPAAIAAGRIVARAKGRNDV